jgi:hypothetical protein
MDSKEGRASGLHSVAVAPVETWEWLGAIKGGGSCHTHDWELRPGCPPRPLPPASCAPCNMVQMDILFPLYVPTLRTVPATPTYDSIQSS